MALKLYIDVHVQRAIAVGLRARGVDVLTAQDDSTATQSDDELLRRATALGRVLFSQDRDLLRIAAHLQTNNIPFAGLIYGHQRKVSIGRYVEDLHLMAAAMEPEEIQSRVEYLPL